MFKQLFLSTALATAFAATPVLADDHGQKNADDPEWEQKINQTENQAGTNADNRTSKNSNKSDARGETQNYDNVDADGNKVTPDKKAYDKNKSDKNSGDNKGNHPAHEMGEGDPAREQGQ